MDSYTPTSIPTLISSNTPIPGRKERRLEGRGKVELILDYFLLIKDVGFGEMSLIFVVRISTSLSSQQTGKVNSNCSSRMNQQQQGGGGGQQQGEQQLPRPPQGSPISKVPRIKLSAAGKDYAPARAQDTL